ncbi:class I SAM-dependent DNA methyltransferase [Streptococcus infantis]|uniref:class I SAM-dependent DNA methyltransferase n=1 Tax=Streptococcus infantis TaxID=68892 RepID=UPI0039C48E23
MEHHFNHRAESFDSPKNQSLADLVNAEIKQQVSELSTKSILDFGGGTGLIALPLAKQAKSVTLVDIAEKMLEQARIKVKNQKLENLHLIQQDLLLKPLEQTYDLIIVSRVLHHMPHLDSSLAMFKEHLTLGGQLFIADYTVPDGENHGFIISELEETLKNHGFSDIQTQILYSSDNLFLDKPSQLFLTSAIR